MALTLFEDTYCTLPEADSFLQGQASWTDSTVVEKEFALRTATRILDQETAWQGVASSSTQPLAWPRATFDFFDPKLNLYVTVSQGSVPSRLKFATAQLALHFLEHPTAIGGYEQTWDSITIGPISLSNGDTSKDSGRIPTVPTSVKNAIKPLLANTGVYAGRSWWRAN